jgi:hypothetical protein
MEVYSNLYVGDDTAYERLKDKPDWYFVRCCKYGPGGHQDTLGYRTLGAPKGKDYYFTYTRNKLALNLLDSDDPNFIPDVVLNEGVKCIGEQLSKGKKVLVACNQGMSRGPTVAMLYLRSINDLPSRFHEAFKIFKGIYHKYDPGQGMEQKAKEYFSRLKG